MRAVREHSIPQRAAQISLLLVVPHPQVDEIVTLILGQLEGTAWSFAQIVGRNVELRAGLEQRLVRHHAIGHLRRGRHSVAQRGE